MLKFISLLCLATGALAGTVRLSTLPRLDGRIVGGSTTVITEYPYQVSVQYYGGHTCGGSIISHNHVLTAAHCMEGYPMAYNVRAGTSNRGSGGSVHEVDTIARHSRYNPYTYDNDVAVIRIIGSFDYSDSVQPVKLAPSGFVPIEGTASIVTGWGATFEGGTSSPQLRFVEVPIVDNVVCNIMYGPWGEVTDNMVCAGYTKGGSDACQGDSGGPLVIDGVQVGIVSWGYGCAQPNFPGVYSSVGYFRSWIGINAGV